VSGSDAPSTLRVLHVAQPTVAGVPTVLLGYLRDQLARGWSVSLACPVDEGWLAGEAQRDGARVSAWPATRSPGPATWNETRRLGELIERAEPQVVHLHSSKAGLAGRLAIRGGRATVFQPHAWSFLAATGALRAASLRWERYATRWTDAVLCVSERERRLGAELGIAADTWVVPNGVDTTRLRPATAGTRAAARIRLGLPTGPLAVCVGRLCTQKGQGDLLTAWQAVRRAVPAAWLAFVGDGPDRAALQHRAGDGAGVQFAGDRADVAQWLAAADVVVVPSRWEGMALVPLEALACGRSVVVTDVAGAAEAVPADAGAIVPVGDLGALAGEIVRRLRTRAQADAEGLRGRAHVVRHHDSTHAAAVVAAGYAQLLDSREPGMRAAATNGR
jgi:glycosyltransferase involved in cell wall biosynthesis